MRTILWIAIFCILAIIGWYACNNPQAPTDSPVFVNEQTPILTKKMLEGWRTGGDLLAKSLALALNDPQLTNLLRASLKTDKRKSILLSNFFNMSANGRSVKSILADRIGKSVEQFDRIVADASPIQVDEENWVLGIHFPVNENFDKWLDGEPALVMLFPWWINEQDLTQNDFYALDWLGQIRMLDMNVPPNEPTLVITPKITCGEDCGGGGSGGGGGSTNLLTIDETWLYDANELWPSGSPDIETRMRIRNVGSWEHTDLDYLENRFDADDCDERNEYDNDVHLNPPIITTEIYQLKVYEEDAWPNSDDLMFSTEIDIDQVFAGPGVQNRVFFSDGSNCALKDIEFWLYWKVN
jgi:hypothetical protein